MDKIAVSLLWILVVAAGVLVGGSDFERMVVTPLWAGAPPLSVQSWTLGAIQRPFFTLATPLYALLSPMVLVGSFALPEDARPWARVAGVVGVLIMIWTMAYFVPILHKTEANRGAGLAPEEITRLVRGWVGWGLVRTLAAGAGWLVAIRALVLASR